MTTQDSNSMQDAASLQPFQGWAWRGASLDITEIAAYTPGGQVKHLGLAKARTDGPMAFPMLFRIYAHRAWRDPETPDEIIFPPDTAFRVRAFQNLPELRICLFLEQCGANFEVKDDLEAEFRAWLPNVAGRLPEPSHVLKAAWEGTFARWGMDAQAGDPPLHGVFYDYEDAVRHVMEFSGLGKGAVESVLSAQERYLDLAHISRGIEDEDLSREREAMRHLLPESPQHIYQEQEMAYLKLVTGLDEDVISLVQAGDLDYGKSIGIVEADECDNEDTQDDESHQVVDGQSDLRPNPQTDLDQGLDAIQSVFYRAKVEPEVADRNDDGIFLLFDVQGDRYIVHLRVTRWPREQMGIGPMPNKLMEMCHLHQARPLQIRVNLDQDSEGIGYDYFGVEAFLNAVRNPSRRWKNHLLAGLDVGKWVEQSGGCNSLRVTVENGSLKLFIDGIAPILPIGNERTLVGPPVDPRALCLSTYTDDECWIFTCGCGVPECNGIWSGVIVVHQGGFTIWRSLEQPDGPLAVFRRWRYRRAILAAMKDLMETMPKGRCGYYRFNTASKNILRAYKQAKAGRKRAVDCGPQLRWARE